MMKKTFMSSRSQNIWETSSKGGASSVRSRGSGISSYNGSPERMVGPFSEVGEVPHERIYSIKSNKSGKSQNVASFIQRNFYEHDNHRFQEEKKVYDKMRRQNSEVRSRDSAAYRTITGSQISTSQ
tara:strand:- start:1156 stop:1533 length:378 start_codon:yes stop_codon:yes gene_type:complete